MINRIVLLTGILFLSIWTSAQERPFQLWNLNSVRVGLSDKSSIRVSEKIQYRTDTGNIGLKYGDVSCFYVVNHWFETGVGGRLLWFEKPDGWLEERRAMFYGNIRGSVRKVNLHLSNRISYRHFKEADDHFRHWHAFTIEVPPVANEWLKLYVSEEGFTLFSKEALYLARIYAGAKIRYNNHLSMKLYYAQDKKKLQSRWSNSDVLGVDLAFSL